MTVPISLFGLGKQLWFGVKADFQRKPAKIRK